MATVTDYIAGIGGRIQARRATMGITQAEAARRSGVSYSTWRRMETEGKASIEDLVKAAFLLRCEQHLDDLFPLPPATSMDELLKQQKQAALPAPRRRARRKPLA